MKLKDGVLSIVIPRQPGSPDSQLHVIDGYENACYQIQCACYLDLFPKQ